MSDVLVVGAGPVGLTLASELARHGVVPRIIEKSLAPSPFCRAIGVTPRSLEVFEDMGVARELINAGIWLDGVRMAIAGHEGSDVADRYTHADFLLELAQQIGSANLVILANHGVIATGRNMAEAVYRAVSIERVCRLAYDVMVTGRTPPKMNRGDMVGMQASLIERAADVYWAGAARMTIKADRNVLT